jgi:dTDP-4-dehydrorhamnose 3,5-epimerase
MRAAFLESFRQDLFNQATGTNYEFIQDNHSRSSKGVLRGLHYQLPPHAQGKLVRVISGAVFDVAVDIRRSSPTFGQWVGGAECRESPPALDSAGLCPWLCGAQRHGGLCVQDHGLLRAGVGSGPALERPRHSYCVAPARYRFSLSEKDRNQPAFKQAELFD